jgi:DNA-binding CsgD family transcriptional regulator
MCADKVGCAHSDWTSCQFDIFSTIAGEVLGPILGSIAKLGADDRDHRLSADALFSLSKAEWHVAQLAGLGLSCKEIARRLRKSTHTVDHQLRCVRRKPALSSHSKLIQFLNQQSIQTLAKADEGDQIGTS